MTYNQAARGHISATLSIIIHDCHFWHFITSFGTPNRHKCIFYPAEKSRSHFFQCFDTVDFVTCRSSNT